MKDNKGIFLLFGAIVAGFALAKSSVAKRLADIEKQYKEQINSLNDDVIELTSGDGSNAPEKKLYEKIKPIAFNGCIGDWKYGTDNKIDFMWFLKFENNSASDVTVIIDSVNVTMFGQSQTGYTNQGVSFTILANEQMWSPAMYRKNVPAYPKGTIRDNVDDYDTIVSQRIECVVKYHVVSAYTNMGSQTESNIIVLKGSSTPDKVKVLFARYESEDKMKAKGLLK